MIWNYIKRNELPVMEDMGDTYRISFTNDDGRHYTRRITVVETSGTWAGLVLDKNRITGFWRWQPGSYDAPVFISNLLVNETGQHRRYTRLPLCRALKTFVKNMMAKGEKAA